MQAASGWQVQDYRRLNPSSSRGTRVLTPTDLQSVSGEDARAKTSCFIVDALGVCDGVRQHGDGVVKRSETARRLGLRARRAGRPFGRRGSQSDKTESRPLDRQPTVPLKTLLQRVLFPGGP